METTILHLLDIMEWLDCHRIFSIYQMFNELKIKNTRLNFEFCEKMFDYNNIAYRFDGNGCWIGRSNLFNNRQFSIVLTDLERKKGVLIPGSRFTPYTNQFFRYKVMELEYKGRNLKQKLFPLTFKEIKEYYYLCSERELLSILESFDINIVQYENLNDYDVFYIPVYNVKRFYEDICITDSEQIILEVRDWGHAKLKLVGKTPCKVPRTYKKKWENEFDELLQKALTVCSSESCLIEDIFAFMIYSNPRLFSYDEHFIPLENHLKKLELLETVDFGVRDKVWIKDTPIVLQKEWFRYVYSIPNILQVSNKDDDFLCSIGSPMNLDIIKLAIYAFLDKNYINLDDNPEQVKNKCAEQIIKDFFSLEKYKLHHKKISTIIKKEYQKHMKKYNPFKYRELMLLSLTVLDLFERMFAVVLYIEEKRFLFDKIEVSVIIMLNQFAEDATPLLKMTESLFSMSEDMDIRNRIREISAVRGKLSNFLSNVEDYLFLSF